MNRVILLLILLFLCIGCSTANRIDVMNKTNSVITVAPIIASSHVTLIETKYYSVIISGYYDNDKIGSAIVFDLGHVTFGYDGELVRATILYISSK